MRTMTNAQTRHHEHILVDIGIISLSFGVTYWLITSGTLQEIVNVARGLRFIEEFVGGVLFTSAFTTVPAVVLLGEIARTNSIWFTAFVGALGALFGDLVLFTFVKDRFSEDLLALIGKKGKDWFRHIIKTKLFRRFSPLIAAIIIGSPFPDELAVVMLGFAKTRTPLFILFSFASNFLGILIVALAAKAIVN